MKILALTLPSLVLAVFATSSSAQRSVQVGVGYNQSGAHSSFGVRASYGSQRSAPIARRGPGAQRQSARRFNGYRRAPVQPYCAPVARRVYVPARYEMQPNKVWIPGSTYQEHVPAVYETRYDFCGNPYRVLVCAASYRTVQRPGHWEVQNQRVLVAAHWETR